MDKRIFLIEWATSSLVEVGRRLKQESYQILYWTGGERGFEEFYKNEFSKTVFLNSQDALHGKITKEINHLIFEPPGEGFLASLSECELIVLSMMNRIDYSNNSVDKRKRFYYELVKYWLGVLNSLKPEVVLFGTTPHLVYDFIIYSLCKLKGIKTIIFMPTKTPDRLLVVNDLKIGSEKLVKELCELQKDVKLDELSTDIREYYIQQTVPSEKSKFPFYTGAELGRERLKVFYIPKIEKISTAFKSGNFHKKTLHYIKKILFTRSRLMTMDENYMGLKYEKKLYEWRNKTKSFRKEYESLQSPVDWNKKFIYVPLQFQPERSTSPEGGVFVDQILMLEILSKSIPDDWILYVKEHLSQWTKGGTHAHQGRYKGYYKEIASMKNAYLVPADILANEFIDKCQAVATVTGTGGWEAILNGKPAIIFGYPSYKECPELLRVSSVESCKSAILKIKNGYKPDKQRVINYLWAFDKVSVKARIERGMEKTPIDSVKENANKIFYAIQDELK